MPARDAPSAADRGLLPARLLPALPRSGQGFRGLMDEVRVWRVARTQEQILAHMRSSEGLENHPVSGCASR